jgi:hypothetical protein
VHSPRASCAALRVPHPPRGGACTLAQLRSCQQRCPICPPSPLPLCTLRCPVGPHPAYAHSSTHAYFSLKRSCCLLFCSQSRRYHPHMLTAAQLPCLPAQRRHAMGGPTAHTAARRPAAKPPLPCLPALLLCLTDSSTSQQRCRAGLPPALPSYGVASTSTWTDCCAHRCNPLTHSVTVPVGQALARLAKPPPPLAVSATCSCMPACGRFERPHVICGSRMRSVALRAAA